MLDNYRKEFLRRESLPDQALPNMPALPSTDSEYRRSLIEYVVLCIVKAKLVYVGDLTLDESGLTLAGKGVAMIVRRDPCVTHTRKPTRLTTLLLSDDKLVLTCMYWKVISTAGLRRNVRPCSDVSGQTIRDLLSTGPDLNELVLVFLLNGRIVQLQQSVEVVSPLQSCFSE